MPRLQMTEVECRMTNFWDLTTDHADNTDVVEAVVFNRLRQIGEHTRPVRHGTDSPWRTCWSLRPATTNFSLCLAIRQKFVLSRRQHQHPGRVRSPEDRAPYGAMRSASVSVWKSVCSRNWYQGLSFIVVCATLFFSPVAKSSHEL